MVRDRLGKRVKQRQVKTYAAGESVDQRKLNIKEEGVEQDNQQKMCSANKSCALCIEHC